MCITPKLHESHMQLPSITAVQAQPYLLFKPWQRPKYARNIFYLMKLTMNAYAVFLCEENNVFNIYFIYYYYFKSLQCISQS